MTSLQPLEGEIFPASPLTFPLLEGVDSCQYRKNLMKSSSNLWINIRFSSYNGNTERDVS